MPVWTIGRLAREFGLSRSSLLHYDSIGLLSPLDRNASGYRLYSEAMVERLRRICAYRGTGMPLKRIAQILERDAKPDSARAPLLKRLEEINHAIKALRTQQRLVLAMLSGACDDVSLCDRKVFVETLEKAGLSKSEMEKFHAAFEENSPSAHDDFLNLLGFSRDEILETRGRSKRQAKAFREL